jgi:hypothetical protein
MPGNVHLCPLQAEEICSGHAGLFGWLNAPDIAPWYSDLRDNPQLRSVGPQGAQR